MTVRSSTVITNPPAKPLVVFDGDCGFCRRWIEVWRGWTGEAVEYGPSQDPTLRERFPEIPAEHFEASIQLIEPDGSVFSGSEAVFRALAHVPGKRWPLWIYEHVRGADWITEKAYGVVAKHRMPFSALTRWILPPEPLKFALVRSIFLRLLGLTYLFAFLSLWTQVDGLIGSHGLLPINQFIEAIGKTVTGAARWHEIPTLCWLGAGDAGLHFQCGAGVVLSFFFDGRVCSDILLDCALGALAFAGDGGANISAISMGLPVAGNRIAFDFCGAVVADHWER